MPPKTLRSLLLVIVKALAPGSKMISARSIAPACEMAVMFETSNVAVSDGSLGTVFGVQFAAVFQSPLVGLRFQVALPAKISWAVPMRRMAMSVLILFFMVWFAFET